MSQQLELAIEFKPRVNLDIILLIMGFATRSVVARFMDTCHVLNHEGSKILLRGPVFLQTERQATSFVQFSQTRDASTRTLRYQLLHSLIFALRKPSKHVASSLQTFFADIAPAIPNLKELVLYNSEELLAGDPGIGPAVAALTTLQKLKVTNGGAVCADTLLEMRSPLLQAHIHVDWDPDTDDDPYWREPDLLLSPSMCATLQTLELCGTTTFPDRPSRRIVLPQLRTLSMVHTLLPGSRELVRSCPGLEHLHVNESNGQKWIEVEEIRWSRLGERRMWSALKSYSGSINVLYMLPLSCPVTRVDVHDESSEFEAAGLRQVLLDTTPLHFSLKTRWMGASCYLDSDFVDTLSQPELWRSVKTLELFVCIRYADKDIILGDMLVRLRSWAFHELHKLMWLLSG